MLFNPARTLKLSSSFKFPARFLSSIIKTDEPPKEPLKIKRVILKNYPTVKTDKPQIVQIDAETKDAKMLTKVRHKTIKEYRNLTLEKIAAVYLPSDYPESVTKEYLPFTLYSNLSSITNTAMSFLSTQALFVALGG